MVTASTEHSVLEARRVRVFTLASVLWINVYGLLLGAPVLLAVILVSIRPLGVSTYLLPLAAIIAAILCLPIGFGNGYVRRIARRIETPGNGAKAYLVQLTTVPRRCGGFRAVLEDADDIGWVTVEGACMTYHGDSLRMQVGSNQITDVKLRNIGFRGLFIYGSRVCIFLSGVAGVRQVEIADRFSLFLPCSRNRTREIYERISSLRKA